MSSTAVRLTEEQQRELGSILWKYRACLERVEFLLEAQLVFATSGRDHRLSVIADLLDEAARTIGELDLRREVLLYGTADRTSNVPSLVDVGEQMDEPWATMFRDHQRWFEQTVKRIQQLLDQSRHTMGTTLDLIDQLVNNDIGPQIDGYDRRGQSVRSSAPAVLFDSRA